MSSKICFFTVCGGGEEYDFLLGSIAHHAPLGNHLVLDVSLEQASIDQGKLPPSVHWAYGGGANWGSGNWKTFKLASALEYARRLAITYFPGTEFLVHLDCDEYYDIDVLRTLLVRDPFAAEIPRTFVFETIHWRDGQALRFGPSEWHMRAWDVRAEVEVIKNLAWEVSPKYNGNPEHHPILSAKSKLFQEVRVTLPTHYHLHYAVGSKKNFTETAEATIDGWPVGIPLKNPCPWPDPIRRWAESGVGPSVPFLG